MKPEKEMFRISETEIGEFQEMLREREYSDGSIENYVRSVRAFCAWSGGLLEKGRIIAWKNSLICRYAPATVNAMIAGLNCFLRSRGLEAYQVRLLRLQRRSFADPDRQLSRRDYQKLVETARASGRERLALVMETMCATGIRVGEVRFITVEAARRGKTEISLKGKIRTILLPGKLCRRLLKYVRKAGVTSGPVFRTRDGNPLSRIQIWAEMKRLCRAAGVVESRVFPHNLRHLFARAFYQAYKDVVKLADILGHSSVNTTRIYLLTTGVEHIRKLERLELLC